MSANDRDRDEPARRDREEDGRIALILYTWKLFLRSVELITLK